MAFKTATDQSFGGRRVGLGMSVLTVSDDNVGGLCARPAVCVEFSGDAPVFRVADAPGYPTTLEFVDSVDLLGRGKWTWPPRV